MLAGGFVAGVLLSGPLTDIAAGAAIRGGPLPAIVVPLLLAGASWQARRGRRRGRAEEGPLAGARRGGPSRGSRSCPRGSSLVVVATLALACAAGVVRGHAGIARVDERDLARILRESPSEPGSAEPVVRLRGTVIDSPRRAAERGALAAFGRHAPRWRCALAVESLLVRERDGAERTGARWRSRRVGGTVWLGIAPQPRDLRPGDRVEVVGALRPFAAPMNPGEFDSRRWARLRGLAGVMTLDLEESASTTSGDRALRNLGPAPGLRASLIRARASLRAGVEASLLHRLPDRLGDESRSLLVAMLLGRRDAALAELEGAFQRTGTAHLVAISGFHLSVLAATTLLLARVVDRTGGNDRRRTLAVMAITGAYLLLVELHPSVVRAGAMLLLAQAGLLAGRRWSSHGVVAMALLGMALWDPASLLNAGLQLSFLVVAALIWIAPRLRTRLVGPAPDNPRSHAALAASRLADAAAIALTAWLVSAPLCLHHFGVFSIVAAPLSLVAVPVASLLLALGYAKALLSPLGDGVALLLVTPLALLAALLGALVRAGADLPWAFVHLPRPGVPWTVAATLAMIGALLLPWAPDAARAGGRRWCRPGLLCLLALLLLAALAAWPARPWRREAPLRIDMLAVGDGTCLLLRSERAAVLFDAGSTGAGIGERICVPALRELGVRRLDAAIVTHPHLDHFAGLLEVVDAFPVGEVILTEPFEALASLHPGTAPAALIDALRERGIAISTAHAADERRFGAARWRWLHPQAGDRPRRVNDLSQVILVESGQRRLLLTGDAEEVALALALARHDGGAIDLLELPHHGSWRPQVAEAVAGLAPTIVLQSTGPRRLAPDRWSALLDDPTGIRTRLVSARDGACWVEVDPGGSLRWGRHVRPRRRPRGRRETAGASAPSAG